MKSRGVSEVLLLFLPSSDQTVWGIHQPLRHSDLNMSMNRAQMSGLQHGNLELRATRTLQLKATPVTD